MPQHTRTAARTSRRGSCRLSRSTCRSAAIRIVVSMKETDDMQTTTRDTPSTQIATIAAERDERSRRVVSRDGTAIVYERSGTGPALILVDGAFCSRAFGPSPKLARLLAQHFTVYTYDRRGRGQSGDSQPYAREREVEDLAALIQQAGGEAFLVGLSSGAALALEAAASGLSVAKVAAFEP